MWQHLHAAKRRHPLASVLEFNEAPLWAADEPKLAMIDSCLDCEVMAPLVSAPENRNGLYRAKRTTVGTSLGQACDPFEAQRLGGCYHLLLLKQAWIANSP